MLWYYAKGNQRFGPVEEAELRRLLAAGSVQRSDLVWREGLPDWRPAGDLETFFPPSPPPPSPAPMPFPAAPYPPPAAPYPPQPVYPQPAWQQPAPAPVATEYASLGARFGAFCIDFMITLVIGFITGFILGILVAASGGHWGEDMNALANLLGFTINFLYFTVFESSGLMATPGKRALGLRVTDLQGRRIGFGRAAGRYFGKFLSLFALGFGYWTIPSSPMRQGWHDKLSGCLVLRTR